MGGIETPVGAKRNIPIDQAVWEKIVDHFIKDQDQKKEGEVKERLTMMNEEEVADRQIRGRKPKEKVDVEVIAKDGEADEEGKEKAKAKDKGGKEKSSKTGVAVSKTRVGQKVEVPEVGTEHVPVYSRGWKYEKSNYMFNKFKVDDKVYANYEAEMEKKMAAMAKDGEKKEQPETKGGDAKKEEKKEK